VPARLPRGSPFHPLSSVVCCSIDARGRTLDPRPQSSAMGPVLGMLAVVRAADAEHLLASWILGESDERGGLLWDSETDMQFEFR
jgi:hypothetical protein